MTDSTSMPQLSAAQLAEIQGLLAGGAPTSFTSPGPEKTLVEWSTLADKNIDKNPEIYCPRCMSKITLADTATLVEEEMELARYKVDAPETEVVTQFWLLPSLMHFENIGVTQMVKNIKFLSCADCEVGPLGWHDITQPNKFYLAAQRVRYLALST